MGSTFAQQSASLVAPNGPLLNSAPAFSQWVVTYAYPQDQIPPQPGKSSPINPSLPRKITTTITKQIAHEDIFTVGGTHLDRWQVGRITYTKFPNIGFWAMFKPDDQKNDLSSHQDQQPLPENGFRGLDWLDVKTYAGTMDVSKVPCLVFLPAGSGSPEIKDFASVQSLPTFACIDEKTRLPALVKEDGVVRIYTFLPPPASVQTLPPDLAADIAKAKEIQAKFDVAPGKEY